MACTNYLDSLASLGNSLTGHFVPDSSAAPYLPSPVESKYYFYGIYSSPRLVARSSTHIWVKPKHPEIPFTPKELSPLGPHGLHAVWEDVVGPAMVSYLDTNRVCCSSLDPVRIGYAGDPSPPAIIWLGVLPGSLTHEDGIKVVNHLRDILFSHSIDIHIEIRESEVTRSARLYKPVSTFDATAHVREPFSTAVGLPISAAPTPTIGGTGGFYISDSNHPGKIFLVTNRHVVFRVNEEPNRLYKHTKSSQSRKNVLLFSESAVEKYIEAIESEICEKETIIDVFQRRLKKLNKMEEDTVAEREHFERNMADAERAIVALKRFLAEVSRDWKEQKDRVIGHVILSPPIGFNVGNDGFTEDWAVIELDRSKFVSSNFVGNSIDLGTTISPYDLKSWMYPNPVNPPSFEYPDDRLLRFHGFISDEEMYKPSSKTKDHEDNPVIMVIKNGHASGLTVGRLNNIRSFTRYCFTKDKAGQMSKEIAVLPRNSKSGPFSEPGDSGSSVIDGRGRFAGLLMGGAGGSEISDIAYLTSANFLHACMILCGLQPNFFPTSID